jgi:hypothetical protein
MRRAYAMKRVKRAAEHRPEGSLSLGPEHETKGAFPQ